MEYGSRGRSENYVVWLIIVAAVGGLIAFVYAAFWPGALNSSEITIGAKTFQAEHVVVSDDQAAAVARKGLTTEDQAMLLEYKQDGAWAVTASSLSLPVDTLWLNEAQKVKYVYKRMQPSSDAHYNVPTKDVRYVLHLPAGSIDQYSIQVGSEVRLSEGDAA